MPSSDRRYTGRSPENGKREAPRIKQDEQIRDAILKSDDKRMSQQIIYLDNNATTGRKSEYAKNWFSLQDSEVDGDTEQLDLVLKIRETLKEYSM